MNFIIKLLAVFGGLFVLLFLYYFIQDEPQADVELTNNFQTINENDFRINFMAGCNPNNNQYAYCSCIYTELRDDYSLNDIVRLYDQGIINESFFIKYAAICIY